MRFVISAIRKDCNISMDTVIINVLCTAASKANGAWMALNASFRSPCCSLSNSLSWTLTFGSTMLHACLSYPLIGPSRPDLLRMLYNLSLRRLQKEYPSPRVFTVSRPLHVFRSSFFPRHRRYNGCLNRSARRPCSLSARSQ